MAEIPLLEQMKQKMVEHPYIKSILDDMVKDGIPQDLALDIMIYAWLTHENRR